MKASTYQKYKVKSIYGRYLPPEKCLDELQKMAGYFDVDTVGHSLLGHPIKTVRAGRGSIRVLMWSQMHGNESTTTKALLDLLNFMGRQLGNPLLDILDLQIIPMLNPDGARAYTRENAADKDLNRDALERSQPESVILDEVYRAFQPDYCFNLHDQRTIYNVGGAAKSARLSFLAPAMDPERSITGNRLDAIKLVAAIEEGFADTLRGCIGRYDDTFNPNCVGDRFQQLGSCTVLFEAGHSPGDYQREVTRNLVFDALFIALESIASGGYKTQTPDAYFSIPENTTDFVDLLIYTPGVLSERYSGLEKLRIQYKEQLAGGEIQWVPDFAADDLSTGRYGHLELDASRQADLQRIRTVPGLWELLRDE
jgi:hypothetical protein